MISMLTALMVWNEYGEPAVAEGIGRTALFDHVEHCGGTTWLAKVWSSDTSSSGWMVDIEVDDILDRDEPEIALTLAGLVEAVRGDLVEMTDGGRDNGLPERTVEDIIAEWLRIMDGLVAEEAA